LQIRVLDFFYKEPVISILISLVPVSFKTALVPFVYVLGQTGILPADFPTKSLIIWAAIRAWP